ncbi:MAG: translation initiation factor IF-2 N-terminal domain-containing protein, partial [Synergistaceae bacterium]
MSKMRVYELAKLLEKSNTEMVDILTDLGVSVKSHMSSVDDDAVALVENALKGQSEKKETAAEESVQTYPEITVKEGCSVSEVASAADEKPGAAVKFLMAAGLMIPATARADEKILEILGKGFKKQFV